MSKGATLASFLNSIKYFRRTSANPTPANPPPINPPPADPTSGKLNTTLVVVGAGLGVGVGFAAGVFLGPIIVPTVAAMTTTSAGKFLPQAEAGST